MITFACPHCKTWFEVAEEFIGIEASCPACNGTFVVPAVSTPPPSQPAVETAVDPQQPAVDPQPPAADEPGAESTQEPLAKAEPGPSPEPIATTEPEPETPALAASPEPAAEPMPAPGAHIDAPASGKINLLGELSEFIETPSNAPTAPVVATTPSATAAPPAKAKLSPRQRRLVSDLRLMRERFSNFPLIHLERTQGDPPELYVVSYRIRGIERIHGEQAVYRDYHEVEIRLPGTYPRTPPTCRMITPIFHPNIEPAIICIGDHWTASERLCDLVVRIGEMIAYQAHNIKSPLDGEAAMWCDLHQDMLPIDNRDLTPPDP